MPVNKTAVATVCTDTFLLGTVVMLQSFKENNPWFKGDIIIIHEQLSQQSQHTLKARFENISFCAINQALKESLSTITSTVESLKKREARFYSLMAFSLTHYQQVIFVDSDILFLGSIGPLLRHQASLVACPDASFYRKKIRDRDTFAELPQDKEGIKDTFNAGLMLIKPHSLKTNTFLELTTLLKNIDWIKVASGHTDQLILNKHFENKVHLASSRYNYLLGHSDLYKKQAQVALSDTVVLHYNGPVKPWFTKLNKHYMLSHDFIWGIKQWRNFHKNMPSTAGHDK